MHSTLISTLALAGSTIALPQKATISPRADVQYFGVNIAGFDFGCSTEVSQHLTKHNST